MSMLKQIQDWQDQARTLEESEKLMAILNHAINSPAMGGVYNNNNMLNAYPLQATDTRKEIGVHELTIRSMENGYIVTSNEGGPGYAAKHYVAKDVDDLCETIKLALVNRKIDAVK